VTITPKYIAMCAAAEEIQTMRAPIIPEKPCTDSIDFRFEHGDFFAFCEEHSQKMITFVHGNTLYQPEMSAENKDEFFINSAVYDEGGGWSAKSVVWLPRLDQLLEIAGDIEMSIKEASAVFKTNREEEFLVVVMRNKYGKKWNGESWVSK